MTGWRGAVVTAGALLALGAAEAGAQGYRLRVDSRMQGVSWRGLTAATIPRAQAVPQPGGGFLTPDGHAAACAETLCTYFLPGPELRGVPWVNQADATVWGFGVAGLSARANARWATDLGDGATWPGTEPEIQVVEGYLEYARETLTARVGRLFLASRLGAYGLDGLHAQLRNRGLGIDLGAYLGWGLARGAAVPVTDPALNPLNDFQPRDRQVAAGAELGWVSSRAEGRLEYRREVDPAVDYLVSERAAASLALRPVRGLTLLGGAEYDLAFGQLGSADLSGTWIANRYSLSGGMRRYRPFFDLWTIWGAFSPVAYHAWHGSASVTPLEGLSLRARGERFRFDDTETRTPGTAVEDRGWRFDAGATWSASARWIVDAGYQAEFGPGASSRGHDGRITWLPTDRLTLAVHGTRFKRPLELRYDDAEVTAYGVDAEFRPSTRLRFGLTATRYEQERNRPDAGALDWDQLRVAGRVTILFGSNPDRLPLPRAVRSGSGGGT